jgi:hypothetical protein
LIGFAGFDRALRAGTGSRGSSTRITAFERRAFVEPGGTFDTFKG